MIVGALGLAFGFLGAAVGPALVKALPGLVLVFGGAR